MYNRLSQIRFMRWPNLDPVFMTSLSPIRFMSPPCLRSGFDDQFIADNITLREVAKFRSGFHQFVADSLHESASLRSGFDDQFVADTLREVVVF